MTRPLSSVVVTKLRRGKGPRTQKKRDALRRRQQADQAQEKGWRG